tara:strand:+ start:1026 stop:1883 length:858 start_codon:yes stop_codon:yes gene_type:complete
MPSRDPIPYLTGFTVKPSSVSILGDVTFTDGTNELTPNQLQCEAYGYTYNKASGTCSTFRFNTNLNEVVANENNRTYGTGNSTETGTNNTLVMGENNTVKGLSRNSIITGNQNEIANGVNNANVSGTLGEATADNSTVLGGNSDGDNLGERQVINVIAGVQTTVGNYRSSFLNNDGVSLFAVPTNAILYFHAEVVAVRVGGTSGSGAVGDYASWVERGVIINKSGTLSINRERDSIKSSGTVTGWQPLAQVDGTNIKISCRGANNMTLEWVCNIRFSQIKTGVSL